MLDQKPPHVFPVHSVFILIKEEESCLVEGYIETFKFCLSLKTLKRRLFGWVLLLIDWMID